jgi:hypothetical protein
MRYFQPKEYQYISQYTPAMMELDYRKGQELLKQEDAFNKDLFDASNNYIIRNPGHLSKQEDVDKANNFFKSNLDKISTEVNSGKLNAREGVNRIKQLSDFYKTDKSVQGLLMDSQATWGEKGFEAQRSTGKLKQGVGAFGPQGRPGSVYIDESNNLHVEKADASQLKDLVGAGAYGVEIPKNALEKYKEFYSYIKPETIAQEIERPEFSINKDGQNYVYSTNKGSFTREEVTRQALRNLATPFVNANMETNPDYEWDRRINMTDVYGFDAAKEKEINNIVNSFPGYYKKEATKDEATINPFSPNTNNNTNNNNANDLWGSPSEVGSTNLQEKNTGTNLHKELSGYNKDTNNWFREASDKGWEQSTPQQRQDFINYLQKNNKITKEEAAQMQKGILKPFDVDKSLLQKGFDAITSHIKTWKEISPAAKNFYILYQKSLGNYDYAEKLEAGKIRPEPKDFEKQWDNMEKTGFVKKYDDLKQVVIQAKGTAITKEQQPGLWNHITAGGTINKVEDLANGPISSNIIYDVKNDEWVNVTDVIEKNPKAAVSFTFIPSPDNNFSLLDPKKDWTYPVAINLNGKEYYVPNISPFNNTLEKRIDQDANKLANLKLSTTLGKGIKINELKTISSKNADNFEVKYTYEGIGNQIPPNSYYIQDSKTNKPLQNTPYSEDSKELILILQQNLKNGKK